MYNPLKLLFKDALDELIRLGHLYFVRQSYPRGKTHPSVKEALLITPYIQLEEALKHVEAIQADHRKLIYNIQDQEQLDKLYHAATQPQGYLVYLNRLKDHEWKPLPQLAANIKQYIRCYTGWKPGRGRNIKVELTLQFGELIINLRNGNDEIQIPLTDLEKI